jgi:outer membrane lipoprotein SlyB
MKSMQFILIGAVATTTLLGGCATNNQPAPINTSSTRPATTAQPSNFIGYGVIENIETLKISDNSNHVTGAVIGGVVGGLLGHQVGSGRGQTVATVAGAVGGALAGQEIEKRSQAENQEKYRIHVRLSNNTIYTVTQDNTDNLRIGDRVRVDKDRLSRATP